MKKVKREDLDFDFDIKKEKKPSTSPVKLEYSIEPKSKKGNRISISGITLDLSDDCLIIRRRTCTTKEKTLIALDEIQSTKVKKVTLPIFLFLSIFFFLVAAILIYPTYQHFKDWTIPIIIGASGFVLFSLFLILFLTTRRLQLIINFSSTRSIKYLSYQTNMFEKLNNFIDEVYHVKHKLYKIK